MGRQRLNPLSPELGGKVCEGAGSTARPGVAVTSTGFLDG